MFRRNWWHSQTQTLSMNLLSTLKKKDYTPRRSARLLATQASHCISGESLDGSRNVQTSDLKRKCAANNYTSGAIIRSPLELQSEPEIDDLPPLKKKKRILGKEHVDPDHENARKSQRKRGPHLEPVHIIPDVEKKRTTFRGRLG